MRLIDADALMEQPVWLCGGWVGDSYAEGYMDALDKVEKTVKSAQTIDAVPVVRCKDCKFAHMTYGGECKYCDAWESEESLYLDGDFFCAFGERKDEEADK